MLDSPYVTKLIDLAIEEDLSFGDITSELIVPADLVGNGDFVTREGITICGLPVVDQILSRFKVSFTILDRIQEGDWLKPDTIFLRATGKVRDLLALERVCLNFLQRMSGVATVTRQIVENKPQNVILLDTRKTIPGWRILDKYSTRIGGARNHRMNLGSMIMLKDNHIDAQSEPLSKVLSDLKKIKPAYMPLEIEVRDLSELEPAIEFSPEAIMLDNFSVENLNAAVAMIRSKSPNTKIEISGGITPEVLPKFKDLGEVYVSMGALTNSARSVDISMNLQVKQGK